MDDQRATDAKVLGLPAAAVASLHPVSGFAVWAENWDALQMFLRLQTQWRVGLGGRTGLDYAAVAALFQILRVKGRAAMLDALREMEIAVLDEWHKNRK